MFGRMHSFQMWSLFRGKLAVRLRRLVQLFRNSEESIHPSKEISTDPWNIPQTLNHLLFMKEILSYLYFGVPGVCSRGLLEFSWRMSKFAKVPHVLVKLKTEVIYNMSSYSLSASGVSRSISVRLPKSSKGQDES